MPFDGIVTKKIVYELSNILIGGKINKVFEPNKNEILLGIYANGKNVALNITIDSNNCRIHLTTHSKPNPMSALNFCMLLRKHIIGYKITNIEMKHLERVVFITLEGYNELNDLNQKKLVIELMGKHSNIILLNDQEFIIDSLRHLDLSCGSYREILPAHPYLMPKSEKRHLEDITDFNTFYTIIEDEIQQNSLDKIIATHFTGISMVFIQHLASKLTIPLINTSKEQLHLLFNTIQSILITIPTDQTSCVPITNQKGKQDYCIDQIETSLLETNFFIDDFYTKKETDETFIAYRNSILKLILQHLKKYTSRLSNINHKLEECKKRDLYRLYGELITSNLYQIPKENLSEIILNNYYENNIPITIPLDETISVANNAKKYFKKYNKLKNALQIVNKQKEETQKELQYIESIIYELEDCSTIEEINDIYTEISENILPKDTLQLGKSKPKGKKGKKQKKDAVCNPLEFTIDGFNVLVGKNNKQNDYLTTKVAHHNDLWFHTKDIHGSHVILQCHGEDVTDTTLIKCAKLAAKHSKAKLSSNVPVDYCFVRYVKKPSGSKPGMVIYTNNKTLNVTPSDE